MSLKVKLFQIIKMMGVIGLLHSSVMAAEAPLPIGELSPLNTAVKKTYQAPVIGESQWIDPEDATPVNLTAYKGQKKFLEEEQELVGDRILNIWGIGLFSSKGADGALIRSLTGFDWSHLGVILIDEKTTDKFCFQSTGKVSDILEGVLPQVQISDWENEVENYDGKVAYRPLLFNKNLPDAKIVMEYLHNNLGRSYETDILSLIRAVNGTNTKENLNTLFCSEMGADLLIKLGFLNEDFRLATNCVPGHFAESHQEKYLDFMRGASLGEQVLVKDADVSSTIEYVLDEAVSDVKKVSSAFKKLKCCTII